MSVSVYRCMFVWWLVRVCERAHACRHTCAGMLCECTCVCTEVDSVHRMALVLVRVLGFFVVVCAYTHTYNVCCLLVLFYTV